VGQPPSSSLLSAPAAFAPLYGMLTDRFDVTWIVGVDTPESSQRHADQLRRVPATVRGDTERRTAHASAVTRVIGIRMIRAAPEAGLPRRGIYAG
jgi:hypothetical protein